MEYKISRLNKQFMTGIIRFDTQPSGAKVFIDNKYIGNSPLDISDVLSGDYTYQLLLDKHKFEGDVIVYDNKISYISVDLNSNAESKEYINVSQAESQEEKTENKKHPSKSKESDKSTEKSPSLTEKSDHEVLEEHLEVMNKILDKNNSLMTDVGDTLKILRQYFAESLGYETNRKYLNSDLIAVTVSTPNKPESPDVIANPNSTPPTPGYDRVLVQRILGRNSPLISVSNEGLTNLFVIVSHDGVNWSTSENIILRGEYKRFANVYEIRVRSSIVGSVPGSFGELITSIISGIPTGGVYRVSEYTTEHYTRNINRTSFRAYTYNLASGVGVINAINVLTGVNVFNLPITIRASPTNTDNVFMSAVDQDITDAGQRITLAPGDSVKLYIMDGTIILFMTLSDGQSIEQLIETDLVV